ncbi:MAG: hypothetical protein BVN35_00650 [Proteobacteria bacterium ST_bin11]|nr:MAG: hypothetical protein BVN35_00650 [Proteobacteria bacterium ST_bin11]
MFDKDRAADGGKTIAVAGAGWWCGDDCWASVCCLNGMAVGRNDFLDQVGLWWWFDKPMVLV